jgi:Carboxypeptidase regulatory-like domain/TonB-dependent Receptor Plug Domain
VATRILLVLFAALHVSMKVEAQVAGTISGYVRDESGAIVPGVDVKATMLGQKVTRSTVSDETGFFNLVAMPRGNYEIAAQLPGFATQQTTAELTAGQNLRVDFKMNLGQLQEVVEVSAAAALVETRSATMSGLVDDRRVQELPLNGRNVVELARTLPGITDVTASQEMGSTRGGPTLIVHGASRGQNNFTLNGSNFTNFSQTAGFNPPPPDAVQEIRVQTSTFSAEYGNNAGAQVSMVTKAGSNDFHGSVWEFHRNDKLNARSFFQPRRPQQRQHQPGASAGGRLLPNRLFYFGSFQALSNRAEAGSSQALVPTDAQRLGDFSGLSAALRNPVDPITGRAFSDASGASCVSANVINPNCISPVARSYLDRFVPRSQSGVAVRLTPSPLDAYNWVTRFDYTASPRNNLFVHYFRDHYHRTSAPSGANIYYMDQDSLIDVKQYAVTDTHTFSPTFLNEATYSFMNAQSFVQATGRVPPRDMGINLDEGYLGVGMSLNVTGQFNLSFPGPERQGYRNWHWRDTMTLIRGSHTLKWGYEGMYVNFDLVRGNGARSATFTGTRSGSAMADFMLGAFDNVSFGFGAADSFPLLWKHQAFFQDELKITPRLTLNVGMRYEPWFPWKQEYGRYTSWAPGVQSIVKPDAPPGILFVGDPGVPAKTVENDLNNFAPRFGFAWDLFGNGRTVVRGGYGMYFNHISGTSVHAAEAPWTGTVQLFSGRIEDPFGSLNRSLPPSGVPISGDFGCVKINRFPGLQCPLYPLPLNFVYNDLEMATPTVHHVNLSFQRQVTNDVMFDVAYVGRFGYQLEGHRHFNPAQFVNSPITGLPPSTQNISERVLYEPGIIGPTSRVLETRYRSWYHGVEMKATRRFSHGVMFSGFYTLSKALDTLLDSGAGLTAGVANPFDLSVMKGRAQFDRRHLLGFSWVWEQRRRFENRVLESLAAGWAISGVHNMSSGIPLNFVMGTDVALDGTGGASRQLAQLASGATAQDIPRDHGSRNDFINAFFNTKAFAPVAQLPRGIYGNMGRNVISGPAMARSDLAVMRNFRLPGRHGFRFQVRGELFNAFNQINFSQPNQDVSSASFGRITSAEDGRVGQLVAKILW